MSRHILSLVDIEATEISSLIEKTVEIANGERFAKQPLRGKTVGIYFRKTSTRTRTAFTVGASKLGATVVTYGPNDLQTNTGETLDDTARVLAGYLDGLVLRTAGSLDEMRTLAGQANMAIVNAMSDLEHPTQALADLAMMKRHFGKLHGLHILYLGEGNSTAAALALAVSKLAGMKLTLLTPEGYGIPDTLLQHALNFADHSGAQIAEYHTHDGLPQRVDVVYTTRWQTTGSTKPQMDWRESFRLFSVTKKLMERVSRPSGTVFMHDLPAVRDEEVTGEVLDGPQSIAFQQAHNKLFGAMAVLEWCLLN